MTHGDGVYFTTFSPDGKYLTTASNDNTARVWEVDSGREVGRTEYAGLGDRFGTYIAGRYWQRARPGHLISSDGRYLALETHDGAKVKDIAANREVAHCKHENRVEGTALNVDGRLLATNDDQQILRVWDVNNNQELFNASIGAIIEDMLFSPKGNKLAVISWDISKESKNQSLHLWQVNGGRAIKQISHEKEITAAVFSPGEKYIATACRDDRIRIWDADTGELIREFADTPFITTMAFSLDDSSFAFAGGTDVAFVFDGQKLIYLYDEHALNSLSFSPDGRYLATGGYDGIAKIWDIKTEQEIGRIKHEGVVKSVVFSPDGKYLATASDDYTARLSLWRPKDMIAEAKTRLTRNLTPREWKQYVGDSGQHTLP